MGAPACSSHRPISAMTNFARSYLAHRLGVAPDKVAMPSTSVVGWRGAPLLRPAAVEGEEARWSAATPASSSRPWRRMVGSTRIASMSRPEAPAKLSSASARTDIHATRRSRRKLGDGQSAAGCAVLWGDPARRHTCCSRKASRPRPPSRLRTGPRSSPAISRSPRPCRPAGSGPSRPGQRPGGSRSQPTAMRAGRGRPRLQGRRERGARLRSRPSRASRDPDRSARRPGRRRRLAGCAAERRAEAVRTGIAAAQRFEPAPQDEPG